jgi:hypothetical protein
MTRAQALRKQIASLSYRATVMHKMGYLASERALREKIRQLQSYLTNRGESDAHISNTRSLPDRR